MLVVCQLTNRTEKKNIFHLTGNVGNLKAFPFPKQCENKQQKKIHESQRKKDKVACNFHLFHVSREIKPQSFPLVAEADQHLAR